MADDDVLCNHSIVVEVKHHTFDTIESQVSLNTTVLEMNLYIVQDFTVLSSGFKKNVYLYYNLDPRNNE
jgi:hypothetical protein